ncbi:MAG: GatB/YqeY domain-containing protein [Nitrospinae bacterium]|nr:GatB/YqeY domain-containing protein [Nitrospinota bacterium]
MSLKSRIEEEFKTAFKAQDKFTVGVLRMIKSEMKNREIEKGGAGYVLTDPETVAVVSAAIKKRRDSVELFTKGGRQEMADAEAKEAEYLAKFLPEMMGEDELKAKILAVIAGMGSPTSKQMGQVMKAVMAEVAGKADNSMVSKLVKEALPNA